MPPFTCCISFILSVRFSIFFQLALSANLILVVLFALLLVFVIIFQIRYKLFFNLYNLCLQFINVSLLFFWIKFSFFYYSKGVLDSGAGNNYWKISFQSLIIWIFGTNQIWVQLIVVCCVLTLLFFMLIKLNKISSEFFSAKFFYPFIFFSLILIFYLQKIILHINFPEDRTGLFFGKPEQRLTIDVGKSIYNWCNAGAEIAPTDISAKIHSCKTIDDLLELYNEHPQYKEVLKPEFEKRKREILMQNQTV